MSIDGVLVFQVIATTLENSCLAVLVGALICERRLTKDKSPWGRAAGHRLTGIALVSAIFTLLAGLPVLWAAAATMSDSALAETAPMLWPVLRSTHVGHMWLLGAAMLLILVLVKRFGQASDALIPRAALWLSLAAFIFSRSAASHAAADGAFTPAVAIDSLHLLLISVWAGIVMVAAWAVLRTGAHHFVPDMPAQAAFIATLSRTATYALIGIVMTGIYNAWRGLGSLANLTSTAYGEVLAIKLVLVMIAIGLGGVNRFRILPDIVEGPGLKQDRAASVALHRFTRILTAESLVLVLAIVAAALLSCMPPAVSA